MSTIPSTAQRRDNADSSVLTILAAAMKRWWVAYINWRMEQGAIIALRLMSDRELIDLGITRSEITRAVRGEAADNRGERPSADPGPRENLLPVWLGVR